MLTFFRRKNSPEQRAAEGLYAALIAQSRNPALYTGLGVPDSVDGRFDSLLLHCFIVMRRLGRGDRAARALSQALYDVMFVEMDRAVREMGVGDLSVKRHVRRMMKAFNGRVAAYEAAIADPSQMKDTLRRNLYGTIEGGPGDAVLARAEAYLLAGVDLVTAMDLNDLVAGRIVWADLSSLSPQARAAS